MTRPAQPDGEEDDFARLAFDVTTLLLSAALEYQRGVAQALHNLTGLLLTTYVALYVALGDTYGFFSLSPALTVLPPLLFAASIALATLQAATHPGTRFQFGNLEQTIAAYEGALDARRRQVVGPGVLTLLGIVAFALVVVVAV